MGELCSYWVKWTQVTSDTGQRQAEWKHLLALEVVREAWTNPVGDIQGSFPVVGWNLSSHVPV